MNNLQAIKQLNTEKKPLLSKKQLSTIPSTDKAINDGYDARIYFHIFGMAGDWYIAGYDPSTNIAYGFVGIAGMEDCPEAGYIDMDDFKAIQKLPDYRGWLEVDKCWDNTDTMDDAKASFYEAAVF